MESLKGMMEAVENHLVDISSWVEEYHDELREFVLITNYYWGLASYIDLFKPKRVLELGTCTGASAVVMARAGAEVDTWDLADKWELPIWPENVKRCLAREPEGIRTLDLSPYDMIFVDIDHEGEEEQKLHAKFLAEYTGVVFYDDVALNQEMLAFWNSIKQEKVPLLWHDGAGFGVVRYPVENQRWLDAVNRVRREHPDWHESAIHQKAGDYMVWNDPDLVE